MLCIWSFDCHIELTFNFKIILLKDELAFFYVLVNVFVFSPFLSSLPPTCNILFRLKNANHMFSGQLHVHYYYILLAICNLMRAATTTARVRGVKPSVNIASSLK